MTEPVAGRKPVLALLMRLLWAAALAVPAFGTQAAVVLTTLYSFGSLQDTNGYPLDGGNPLAGLVQGSDGYFYGTTSDGGTNLYCGTVFKISTNGALTSLYSFGSVQDTNGFPLDGAYPAAALVRGSDGYFYGTTAGGGTNNLGTVFKISTNGTLTSLYSFTGGSDGSAYPSGLVQGSDGLLYGTTQFGGTNGYGTVFRISTNGMLTVLHSFTGGDGAIPSAGLVQGSDGYFYGTTQEGGTTNYNFQTEAYGYGTVFKMSTSGAMTTLYAFGSVTNANGDALDGASPAAALVQGNDGYFYGTTANGGTNDVQYRGDGTVFRISTNGALTSLYSFTGGNDGANPHAGLVQGSDGNFYGTTWGIGWSGGVPSPTPVASTVFQITTNGILTSLYSSFPFVGVGMDSSSTSQPNGLVQGSDGFFYGTTRLSREGGTNGVGTVFRLTIVPQPQLTIIPSGPYVILAWPTNYSGFTLQSTTNLGSSAVWTTNSLPPVVIGGENVVINTTTSGKQQFYRLSQ